jgi:hypothetical protein
MSAILTSSDAQRRTLIDASVSRIKRMIQRRNELQKAIDVEIRHRNQLLDGYGDAALAEAADGAMRDAEASMVSDEDLDSQIDDSHDGIFA